MIRGSQFESPQAYLSLFWGLEACSGGRTARRARLTLNFDFEFDGMGTRRTGSELSGRHTWSFVPSFIRSFCLSVIRSSEEEVRRLEEEEVGGERVRTTVHQRG